MRISRDEYFMQLAETTAKRSPCLSRQVGCVLVNERYQVLSTGYNGPPSGMAHCETCARLVSGRDLYSCNAVHAEMNALLQCADVFKVHTTYVTISPCAICARILRNTSCSLVIYRQPYADIEQVQLIFSGELRSLQQIKIMV